MKFVKAVCTRCTVVSCIPDSSTVTSICKVVRFFCSKLSSCLVNPFRKNENINDGVVLRGLVSTANSKNLEPLEFIENTSGRDHIQQQESIEIKFLHHHNSLCSIEFCRVDYKGANTFKLECQKCRLSQFVSEPALTLWMLQDLHEREYHQMKAKILYAKSSRALKNHHLNIVSKKPPEVEIITTIRPKAVGVIDSIA